MIIEKIELENFRCHSKQEFLLSKGINLIIGKNGSGKSSILEAIGLVLLGENEGRGIIEQIKLGEKECLIRITFVGNDGIRYVAERIYKVSGKANQTKKTISRLFQDNSEFPISEDKNTIQSKCAELLGLEKNPNVLYKNVISAYQNQFVDMFKTSAGKNVDIINSIFDTEIYKTISDYIKQIKDERYSSESKSLEKIIENEKAKLIDTEALELKISELSLIINNYEKNIIEIEQNSILVGNETEQLNEQKNKINQMGIQYENTVKFKDSKEKDLCSISQKIKIAELATGIVENNKADFEKYKALTNEILQLAKQISELEKFDKRIQANLELMNADKQALVKVETDIVNHKHIMETENSELIRVLEKIAMVEAENISLSENLNAYEKKFSEEKQKLNEIENEIELLNEIQLKLHKQQAKLEDKSISNTIAEIDKKIVGLLEIGNSLVRKKVEKDKLESEKAALGERIKDNELAAQELTTGICPILRENCKNISADSNSDYFTQRNSELNSAIKIISDKIEANFSEIEDEISKNQQDLAIAKSERIETEKMIHDIYTLTHELELLTKDKIIVELKINRIMLKFGIASIPLPGYTNIMEGIKIKIADINLEINKLNTIISENIKNISEHKKKQNIIQSNIENYNLLNMSDKDKSEKIRNQINVMGIENLRLSELLNDFDKIKIDRNNKSIEAEACKPAYELYTANLKVAESRIALESELSQIQVDVSELILKILELDIQGSELKLGFSDERLSMLLSKKARLESNLKEMRIIQSNSQTQLALELQTKTQNEQREQEISIHQSALSIISDKIALSEQFRQNLKEMSREITKRRLQQIEHSASENYRTLSGKNERIEWTTLKDNFSVRLVASDNTIRTFEMLSGGEQVSVALSLRSALASLLTRSNFAIFDEPTINLDVERKIALSENLHKMLKTMEQSIIVTHDGLFEEIAETKIELL